MIADSSDAVDRFLEMAAQYPSAVAVKSGDEVWSYSVLETVSRAYAETFSREREPRVAIALPQINHAYAAIIGCALAGGYHSPLNVGAPLGKLVRIIERLRPTFVVASAEMGRALVTSVPPGTEVIAPEFIDPGRTFRGSGSRSALAYVMFTSGSTGEPKGVMIPRRGLNNYVSWLSSFGARPGDRMSQQPNLAFDISMTDIFSALCFGASLHPLVREEDRLFPARFIRREGITVWNSTPSAVSLMMRSKQLDAENVGSVRLFNFCGEPLYRQHLEAIFAANRTAIVHNTYGPTEATIAVTCLKLTSDNYSSFCGSSVAIGEPIGGMRIELAGGSHLNEGEVVIFGPQLASGYWEDHQKTQNAFRSVGSERGYWTGDWAVRDGDAIYFKERIDFQVKVRGFRIELDEVAAAIRTCGWPTVVVFKWRESLCGLVEPVADKTFDESALKVMMGAIIESYAIPERIMQVEQIPRSSNDKLDRSAAAQMFSDLLGRKDNYGQERGG